MKKGDRVIKIIDTPDYYRFIGTHKVLKKGFIGTIREIQNNGGLLLEEILNPINEDTGNEHGYFSTSFKKLVSDEELLEYRKNVSSKENLRPELIPIKHLTEI